MSTLDRALSSSHPAIQQVVKNAGQHELQVVFSPSNGSPQYFKHEGALANSGQYFYPASTVKLPMVLLAAERVSKDSKLAFDTPYKVGKSKRFHTIGEDIKRIFAISDDQAYNRLYEWIGRDAVNIRMRQLGYPNTRISHRLATANSDEAQRERVVFETTQNPTRFNGTDSAVAPLELSGVLKGNAYISHGELIQERFNFSFKNYFPLEEQHRLLNDFMNRGDSSFELGELERQFVLDAMAATPSDAGVIGASFFDSYVKFFMFGDTRAAMPENIKIYNKVGYAYGTITDNAYIVDEKFGIKFHLSATLLVNKNRVFNDDAYEYDTVGIPFLAQLGREIYTLELAKRYSQ